MFKRVLAVMLIMVMVFSLVACNSNNEAADNETPSSAAGNWKIGIMTGTVSQNEEEYRAAQDVLEKYGDEHIILMTYPDKFDEEQETTIANMSAIASDPDVKAIIIVQAVSGTSAAIDKAKEINPDLLFIAGVPGENPQDIAARADIVLTLNDLAMGKTMVDQAKKQGAEVFVHYSFPRHMSYALLAARRDLLKENCEAAGIEFVDATALDPTGDAGLSGAQQFILEDTPRKIEKYGKNTAFFSTNCGLQIPLIKSVFDGGAIYPQPCCPSPYHGFPSALGIEVPEEKQGDLDFMVEAIKAKAAEKGMTGRISTWPVPCAMMFVDAGTEYAIEYINGNTNGKLDIEMMKAKFKEYSGVDIDIEALVENDIEYDNFLMVLLDYLDL